MQTEISAKRVIDCIFASFFITIFALYCSGRVGWFLLLVFLLAPAFSALYAKLLVHFIRVEAALEETTADLQCHLTLNVTLINTSFLPSTPLFIILKDNPHLRSEKNSLFVTLQPRSQASLKAVYTARYAGGSYIGIESIRLTDFFRIFSFPVKITRNQYDLSERSQAEISLFELIAPTTLIRQVGVIPRIERPDFGGIDRIHEFLSCFQTGESEESANDSSLFFNGTPGYEYREYAPGDPLKRINSKLSAKRDTLWVRLDEKQAVSSVMMILDPYMESGFAGISSSRSVTDPIELDALLGAATLESALGIISILLMHDFSVFFVYRPEGEWSSEMISGEESLAELEKKLSSCFFVNSLSDGYPEYLLQHTERPHRLPPGEWMDSCPNLLYCTPKTSPELEALLKERGQSSNHPVLLYQTAEEKWRQL